MALKYEVAWCDEGLTTIFFCLLNINFSFKCTIIISN